MAPNSPLHRKQHAAYLLHQALLQLHAIPTPINWTRRESQHALGQFPSLQGTTRTLSHQPRLACRDHGQRSCTQSPFFHLLACTWELRTANALFRAGDIKVQGRGGARL